jgi:tetratricopeptide (TPR) repeat protein
MNMKRPWKQLSEAPVGYGIGSLILSAGYAAFLAAAPAATSVRDDPVQLYASSPTAAHQQLRALVAQGQDVGSVIDELVKSTGDKSFQGLRHQSHSQRNALRIRKKALEHWELGDLPTARILLLKARDIFLHNGAETEAGFCAYQIGEIYAEEERFSMSLRWIDQTLERTDTANMIYLSGLLFESKGYSLWFLDDLQSSILSFLEAVKRWQQINFTQGITNAWNNLATLYEELGMTERAEQCYDRAIQHLGPTAFPEQKFHVHRNYSLFLHRKGDSLKAAEHLEQCRIHATVSPDEFLLAQAEILGDPEILEKVEATQPSIQIERDLLRTKLSREELDPREYTSLLQQIHTRCREDGLAYYSRETCFLLGKAMEQAGRYRAAAEIYQSGLNQDESIAYYGSILPYWQAVSPLFDGWIRCQIQLGEHQSARKAIQQLSYQRRVNASRVLSQSEPTNPAEDELSQLVQLGTASQSQAWKPQTAGSYTPGRVDGDFVILELWPDGRNIHAWIESLTETRHVSFQISERTAALTQRICEYFYHHQSTLSPSTLIPPTDRLYTDIIAPLDDLLTSRRILLIPHKDLQIIPFELLQCPDGRRWGEKRILSYLPDPDKRFKDTSDIDSAPLLLLPSGFSDRAGAQMERAVLRQYDPKLQLVENIDIPGKLTGRWIHVSTHFSLHPDFWPASSFQNGSRTTNLLAFAKKGFECQLLSLAVCESANAYNSGSPYWLGVTELFLAQGAQSLIANRWSMDEFSAEIFVDFYRRSLSGRPMDEALYLARNRFLTRRLPRNGQVVSGAHPYFWAGICYVGWPEKKLQNDRENAFGSLLPPLVLTLSVALAGYALYPRRRPRSAPISNHSTLAVGTSGVISLNQEEDD